MKTADRAYAAGFFDGEGTVYLKRDSLRGLPRWQLCVRLINTDESVVRWFGRTFGGRSFRHRQSRGSFGRKTQYGWDCGSKRGETFLRLARPWLKVKRARADRALDFRRKFTRPWGGRDNKPAYTARQISDRDRYLNFINGSRMLVALVMVVLGLLLIPQAYAGSAEVRYWQGFTNSTVLQLTLDRPESRWGFRAWGALGQDDPTPFWNDRFYGADVSYRVNHAILLYAGWHRLERDLSPMTNLFHGPTVGIRGEVPLFRRISAVYDFGYLPVERQSFGSLSGTGTGRIYQWGVRYTLPEGRYFEVGHWDFRLETAGSLGGGSMVWLGPYATYGIRF